MRQDLLKGQSYLIRKTYFFNGNLDWIHVLEVSETAYRIEHENGHKSWISKDKFHGEYAVVEELKPTNNTF